MRRIVGTVLLGLFGFFLAVGLLAQFYAPQQLKKTPLDINTLTTLSGEGSYLGAPTTPVSVWKRTQAIADSSTSEVIVMKDFTCVMKNADGMAPTEPVCAPDTDERLISASEDLFATDRVTAVAVNDAQYIGTTAEPHEGLVNKFPFDVEQTTYQVWDGVLGRAVDASFDGEDEIDGLSTYRFVVTLADEPIEVAEGVPGTYSDDKTMWIDPVTGSFIDQKEHQVRTLDSGDTVLDLTLGFTPETVQANVDSAGASGSQLGLLAILPWASYVFALVALAGGIYLLRTAPSTTGRPDDEQDVTFDELRGTPA
jgi:hypothetical protein